MSKPLKVLIVEDSKDDTELLLHALQSGGFDPVWERVETEEAMEAALGKKKWDIVIADYRLPKFSAPNALEVLKKTGIDIPFIIVSGTVEEDAIVLSLKAGARDFFRKDRFKLLPAAVDRELKEVVERRDRKLAEDALKESERKLRAVFDQTFQFIGMMTLDGTLIEANRTAMRFSGIDESDCLGKPFWDTPWWKHSMEMQNKVREATIKAASGETVRFEATHIDAEGNVHYIDFSVKPVKDESGKIIFLVPEGRDITERKHAEEALRKSEARYRTIIENVYDIVYSCTTDGAITFITPNISVLGYSIDEVIGRRIFEFVHPDDLESMKKDFEFTFSSGEAFPSICRLKKKSGEYIYIEEVGKVVMKDGKPEGINGVIRDITDRKRYEVELKKSQEELSEWSRVLESRVRERTEELEKVHQRLVEQGKLALLGQVSASISHELRTPLTGIRNSIYLMQMLGVEKDNPKIAENIALINMEIDACIRVLNNMLDFVRPKAPITKESRLDVVISNTLASIMIPQNIKVSKEIPSTLPNMMIDAMEIGQAFDNIIKNAIEAMNMGGELTVAARVEENYVVVEFSDTGAGILHDNLHKIFDPLFSTSPTGVGLGLTIARQLIEAHGGTIEARSEPGKGSTFTVRLPVS